MARDSQAALVALNRFGFGARGGASGDFVNAASDPRGFVKAELNRPNGVLLEVPGLLSTPAYGQAVFAYQAEVKQAREAAAKSGAPVSEAAPAQPAADPKAPRRNLSLNSIAMDIAAKDPAAKDPAAKDLATKDLAAKDLAAKDPAMKAPENGNTNAAMAPTDAMQPNAAKQPTQPLNIIQKTYRAEALARLQRATIADCGFTERLVAFWSNHFCISANKGELARMWAGSLAREIMELHTLGVGGGYSQDDVTSLARIITGWSFAGRQGQLGTPGSFVFNANAHQPGAQPLLGKTYENNGVAQGEAALADIARHPSTAKFIATKFARHFVADDPPQALVAQLQEVFRKSDGDLKALTVALVDSDEAWQAPLTKLRNPYEFLVATGRLLARIPDDPANYLGGLNLLGQPLWSPSGPNGFPDTNAAWAAPEGMKLRLDISAQLASRVADKIDPRDLLELVAADAASEETRRTIERAESRQQALALLLMSPEFQRR